MALVKAQLLDSEGTLLFEAMVACSGTADAVLAAAAEALHAAASAVADGTMDDVRSVQRVSGVQIEEREIISLDTVIRWMIDNGRAGEAAVVTTALAESVDVRAESQRSRFRVVSL